MPSKSLDLPSSPSDAPASRNERQALADRLTPWQPPLANAAPGDERKKGKAWTLAALDPETKPFSSGEKARDKEAVETLASELDALQNLFYADKRHKLLVILQGSDTSGKDGTLRGVFGRMSPLGVRTVGWKAPTEEERSHDYLWRIHQAMPGAGEIMIFNRSHYEDVLVPPVNGWITPAQTAQRYRQINDFERLLSENGTVILKFMLHISFKEQGQRLQERLDDPAKQWKFSLGDLEVRKQWDSYQQAYEDLLQATSTPWAPWTVVPADSKTHRNLMIATLVRHTLQQLDLRYPPQDPALKGIKMV
jgi:PPK2 family polyphosphate:nucleotide phosphotransferase